MSGYKARRVVDDGEANDPIMQFSIIKSSLRGNEEKKLSSVKVLYAKTHRMITRMSVSENGLLRI